MGLFDLFKKKKTEDGFETEVPAEVNDHEEVKEAEEVKVVDDGRRFTLLVEQAFQMKEEKGVIVVGDLFGKMKNGDKIYVLFPNNRMIITTVEEMEVGPGRVAVEAENEKVAIKLSEIERKEQVPQFTVITNIMPNPDTKEGKELENPQLFAMTMEYPVRGQEPAYNNFLVFVLCHAKYVVPASITNVEVEGRTVQQVGFPSLPDANDPSKQLLPLFTDWTALSRWEGLFNEEHPEQSLVLTFKEAVAVCKGKGFVINPFGPMSIVVTEDNIDQIVNLESYKKEFGGTEEQSTQSMPENKGSVQQNKPGMLLGVPKADNPEVKAVTDAIVAYAKQDATIKRVDLLLKADMQQNKSFVCVVDCPADQTARIGEGILRATAYQRKEVKSIEFFLFGSAKFVDDMVSEQSIIYQE